MMKKKFLKVSKDGHTRFFGGYACDGEISSAHSPLSARMFDIEEHWYEEEELLKAEAYLEENGFTYKTMILEFEYYQEGE